MKYIAWFLTIATVFGTVTGWAETPAVRYFNELKAHKKSSLTLNEYQYVCFFDEHGLDDTFLLLSNSADVNLMLQSNGEWGKMDALTREALERAGTSIHAQRYVKGVPEAGVLFFKSSTELKDLRQMSTWSQWNEMWSDNAGPKQLHLSIDWSTGRFSLWLSHASMYGKCEKIDPSDVMWRYVTK
jgi:hypothetical protein